MTSTERSVILCVSSMIIGFILGIVFISFAGYTKTDVEAGELSGYRKGQIDALTGSVTFKLVTKPDSTRVWEKTQEVIK